MKIISEMCLSDSDHCGFENLESVLYFRKEIRIASSHAKLLKHDLEAIYGILKCQICKVTH